MKKKQLTAGIYNRWLFTLGGGEQVTFAFAETLRDLGYNTSLLTHKVVDLAAAESKMNVNLTNINLRYLPLTTTNKLSAFSEEYDVFINTSYLDYFPNRSKKGILSVFFPGEIYLSPWEYLKRNVILPSIRNFFIYPTLFDHFLYDEYKNRLTYKWLSDVSSIFFTTKAVKEISLEIFLPTFAFSVVESLRFSINDKPVKISKHNQNHTQNTVVFTFHSKTPIRKISIENPYHQEYKAALVKLTIPDLRFILYNIFKSVFPRWEMRLHGGPGFTTLSDLKSYQNIITISKFCQKWIKNYWGLPSDIIYPPVNIAAFASTVPKKNWITHIGRFFVTGHSKKQLDLIRVFKEMVDNKQSSGWELHLIGSVHLGESHQNYYEACVKEAEGYPITFHIGASFSELQEILTKSTIYWHATGLDENPNKEPVLMEHFGITTVEAMAAGCVPVVINAGGQPEIIIQGAGFIWNTREELKKYTQRLIKNKKLRTTMMGKAIARSHYFGREAFKKRFKEILSD